MFGRTNSIFDLIPKSYLPTNNRYDGQYMEMEQGLDNNYYGNHRSNRNNKSNMDIVEKYKSWTGRSGWDGGVPDQWTAFDALLSSTRSLITSDNKLNTNALYNIRTLLTNHASPQFVGIYLDEVVDAMHGIGISNDHINFFHNMVTYGDNREKRSFSEHLLGTVNAVLNNPMSADEFMRSVNDFININKQENHRSTNDAQEDLSNNNHLFELLKIIREYVKNNEEEAEANAKAEAEAKAKAEAEAKAKAEAKAEAEAKARAEARAKTSKSLKEEDLERIFRQTLNSGEYNSFIKEIERTLCVSRSKAEKFIKDQCIKIGDKRWDIIKDLDVNKDGKFNGHDYNRKYRL